LKRSEEVVEGHNGHSEVISWEEPCDTFSLSLSLSENGRQTGKHIHGHILQLLKGH